MSEVLVVGAGEMAAEYLRVLAALRVPARIASRGAERARALGERFGVPWQVGEPPQSQRAIVAVSPQSLAEVAARLDCERMLLEKPGALSSSELAGLAVRGECHLAYNRRFYPSVALARRLVEEDGELLACRFDVTELEERVLPAAREKGFTPDVLERWGVVNSLHVIDLFVFLAGLPTDWEAHRRGRLDWHPSGATFAGAGATDRGAAFSYVSSWGGAGGWAVELTTPRRRLLLRPLERVAEQRTGSLELRPIQLDPEPDGLKPGLLGLVSAWLEQEEGTLCTRAEAVATMQVAERIFGYE